MSASQATSPVAEETRRRIADVAERLFRSMGYQKTAVADIARELGMSPANIYRFFPSKSAINEAIADRLMTGLALGGEAIAAGPGSAESRIFALAEHFRASEFDLFFSERRMHDMVSAAMTEHWGVIERFLQRYLAMVSGVVAAGIQAGEFAPGDPMAAARVFKHAMLAWHHPVMVQECLRLGLDGTELMGSMRETLAHFVAGLKHGVT